MLSSTLPESMLNDTQDYTMQSFSTDSETIPDKPMLPPASTSSAKRRTSPKYKNGAFVVYITPRTMHKSKAELATDWLKSFLALSPKLGQWLKNPSTASELLDWFKDPGESGNKKLKDIIMKQVSQIFFRPEKYQFIILIFSFMQNQSEAFLDAITQVSTIISLPAMKNQIKAKKYKSALKTIISLADVAQKCVADR
jgi:hypothetical protein